MGLSGDPSRTVVVTPALAFQMSGFVQNSGLHVVLKQRDNIGFVRR